MRAGQGRTRIGERFEGAPVAGDVDVDFGNPFGPARRPVYDGRDQRVVVVLQEPVERVAKVPFVEGDGDGRVDAVVYPHDDSRVMNLLEDIPERGPVGVKRERVGHDLDVCRLCRRQRQEQRPGAKEPAPQARERYRSEVIHTGHSKPSRAAVNSLPATAHCSATPPPSSLDGPLLQKQRIRDDLGRRGSAQSNENPQPYAFGGGSDGRTGVATRAYCFGAIVPPETSILTPSSTEMSVNWSCS